MTPLTVADILVRSAEKFPENTAFIERGGEAYTFVRLLKDSRTAASVLKRLEVEGRPAAICGEVSYVGLAAMFGSFMAGCPFIPLGAGLSESEICGLTAEYEAGVLFLPTKYAEAAAYIRERMPLLKIVTGLELLAEIPEGEDAGYGEPVDPASPACLFRTPEGEAVMLSHKNICSSLASVSDSVEAGSYTFLCPSVWGDAFDCVMGLLLPLSAGCGLIRRGEKRGVTKIIAESGATAITCTPQRLRNLERSLRFRSEQNLSKAAITVYGLFDRLGRVLGLDLGKRMHRRVRRLIGDRLRLILCGGGYPERDSAMRFTDWGMEVRSYYFTAECGPLAVSDLAWKKLLPLAELSVPSPISGAMGELFVSGDRVPIGYFNGKTDFDGGFPTGDVGSLSEDGTLELRGRKKTMLCGRDGLPIFPEELAEVVRRSRYVADCTITGRFDTKTADTIITAHLAPDFREVNSVLGEKYSDNRLKLFFDREMAKLAPALPRKIDEFRLPRVINEV